MIASIQAKTLLSSRSTPDPYFGCKYNMNLYRGCQHQCIYCDSRSECYGIENFADILYKENALELLKKELASKRVKGTISFGSMNDPYMPIERELRFAQQALEIIKEYKFPIHIITKSDLVTEDIDLIKEISSIYAAITFTITTFDDILSKKIEPGAPASSNRFKAIKKLSSSGIYTGITLMPILPYINDTVENIENIVTEANRVGAKYILAWFGVTLRDRQRDYFYKKLEKFFPGVKAKYQRDFGNNYECISPNNKELQQVFYSLCKRYSIATKIEVYEEEQLGIGV